MNQPLNTVPLKLYAKYQATGKYVEGDHIGSATVGVDVYITPRGFECYSIELGSSPVYDVSDSRDAVHRFVRSNGFYLLRVREVDINAA